MKFTSDNRVGDLNKEATAAKRAGDWVKAIRLLREAKEAEGDSYANTRLAKFLQESGDFEGAMEEIEALIKNSRVWTEGMFGHQPRSVQRAGQASWISRIHKDAALICKRAKNAKLQAFHERECERWFAMKKKLDVSAKKDKADERQGWEDAKKQGARGMAQFLEKKRSGKLP
ncbi:tetratricopeptide repeat protein [Zoogloea oleivorans]|uniref:tetratricopeptide repeat protein n=1 Tax=Zoogloea oleivorans TaxID=1552750 RepID=UPI002A361FE1|nr:tetratricopeptide repeat protein [Zoogloea oleivorans]